VYLGVLSDRIGLSAETPAGHEHSDQAIVIAAWIRAHDDRLSPGWIHLFVDEDRGGRAVQRLVVILRMVHEHEITFSNAIDLVEAGHQATGITEGLRPDHCGDLGRRSWWYQFHSFVGWVPKVAVASGRSDPGRNVVRYVH